MKNRRFLDTALSVVVLLVVLQQGVFGIYLRPDLERIPVQRLIENLSQAVNAKPEDAGLRMNLARAYAMAYASKAEQTQIRKGKPEQGNWFGFEPKHVPFKVVESADPAVIAAAAKYLEQAVAEYQQVLKLAPDHLTARMGYAWCLDQAGKKTDAVAEYRRVIKQGWESEQSWDSLGPGQHSIVVEAAGYLQPQLDKEKDQAELTDLADKQKQIDKLPRAVTPIAIPLQPNLKAEDIADNDASVLFDAEGSGEQKHWSWIRPNAAWLVTDVRNDRQPGSALRLFGNVTFWCFWENGYEALRSLDDNRDGRILGTELAGLALWHDRNCNGVADAGEVRTLAEHGITSLSCEYQIDQSHLDRIPFAATGVTFTDGETRPTFDLLLHRRAKPTR